MTTMNTAQSIVMLTNITNMIMSMLSRRSTGMIITIIMAAMGIITI